MKTNLPKLRAERSITQQELADKMNVSRQTIISIESGKYNPSIILAHNIAEYFNKTIEQVFIFEDKVEVKKNE
jgi:putative transcriptional regulator